MNTSNNDMTGIKASQPEDPDIAEQARPNHGVPSQDPDAGVQVGMTAEESRRESKSALVGGGVMAGLATGAAVGAMVGGPIGVVVGGTLGTIAGALGGEAAGSAAEPQEQPRIVPAPASDLPVSPAPGAAHPLPTDADHPDPAQRRP